LRRSMRADWHRRTDDRARPGALDHAIKYVRERKQFGKAIASSRPSASDCPRCNRIGSGASHGLPRRSIARRRQPFLTEAAMCKIFSSEVASACVAGCQPVRRLRLREGLPVEKLYRDAKIGQIYEGTSNLQLQTIAKQILG